MKGEIVEKKFQGIEKELDKEEKTEIIPKEREADITKEMSIKELLSILGSTVKHDNVNKLITFLSELLAYTEESQFNVSYRAPSATGKSYIPIELASYFPEQDVIMIAYSSPTSFYHDAGEWDNEIKGYRINLERKILIFLDQPHDQLLQRLRPLLSHDKRELLYKITDKRERKGLRTKNVIIRGYPSVIFCTGSLKIDEQEATRNFVLSPEVNQEKLREAIFLKTMKRGNFINFSKFVEDNIERKILKKRIQKIKEEEIKHIIISNPEKVAKRFIKKYTKLKPRHTRDIERLISLIQGSTLFNLWHRPKDEDNNLYATKNDINTGFRLFEKIAESQELGIPPYIFKVYQDVFVPLFDERKKVETKKTGIERKEVMKKHYEVYGTVIPEWFLKQEILPALESAGLIEQAEDPDDKRKTLVYPPSYST